MASIIRPDAPGQIATIAATTYLVDVDNVFSPAVVFIEVGDAGVAVDYTVVFEYPIAG